MTNKKKFVPFSSVPKKDRPSRKQGRDEIKSMRKLRIPDSGRENWMNNPRVARRSSNKS